MEDRSIAAIAGDGPIPADEPTRERMTLSQIRYGFGRPIGSATVEPSPADGFELAEDMLDLDPTCP